MNANVSTAQSNNIEVMKERYCSRWDIRQTSEVPLEKHCTLI